MILPGIGGLITASAPGASGYSEIGNLGNSTTQTGVYSTAADEHGGFLITVPGGGVWVKTWHCRVNGVTSGSKMKPVIWNSANGTSLQSADTPLKVGQEIVFGSTIANGSDVEFIANINSDGSAYFIPAGTYGIGYHSSAVIRINADLTAGAGPTYFNGSDTYSDGVAGSFGTPVSTAKKPMFWMPYSVGGP